MTKRLHNGLHGFEGDGSALDGHARRIYEETLAENAAGVVGRVRPDDVVIFHDPQCAGLVPALRRSGAAVIWRCHIGVDEPNELVRGSWDFLRPYVTGADACVFSREQFVWDGLERDRVAIIAPTIDVLTPKNAELAPETVRAILRACALVTDGGQVEPARFVRQDETPGLVQRRVQLVEDEPLLPETPIVVQVSRWDALKDPVGVIRGFAEHVPAETGCHLVHAGPAVEMRLPTIPRA